MLFHKTYQTEKDRLDIIARMEAKGFTQVATDGYFIGEGHLLFEEGRPERDLAAEIDELKAGQTEINEKLNLLLTKG